MKTLSTPELQAQMQDLPGWEIRNGLLERTVGCPSYADAVALAIKVAMLAEKIDHHPDALEIGWKKLRVAFVTHSAGGLTELDFRAALRVDALMTG